MGWSAQAETIAPVPAQTQATDRATDWSTLLIQARADEASYQPQAAEVIYRQILSQPHPGSMNDDMYFSIQLELGRNLENQGKLPAAIAIMQQVITAGRGHPDQGFQAKRNLEALREQLRQSEANIATGLQKIQTDPNSPWGYQDLATGLAAQGQLDQGLAFLERRLGHTLLPVQEIELARAAKTVSQADVSPYNFHRKYIVAIELYRQLVQRHPNDEPAQSELLDILELWAQLEEAIAAYRQAIQQKPALIWVYWQQLTRKLEMAGTWKEAQQVYDQMIQQKPAAPDVYLNLGDLLEQRQQPDRALQVYLQAIQTFPAHRPSDRRCHVIEQTGYDRLVKLLAHQNRLAQVLPTLETAQPNPTAEMYNNLILALEYQGHQNQAAIVNRRLLESYPKASLEKGGCGGFF